MKQKLGFVLMMLLANSAFAQKSLQVFGPGGPAPAMKACASAFEKSQGVKVGVVAGPLEKWSADAKSADIYYSGSENMMDSFVEKLPNLEVSSIQTHYLRPSAILVRPKNPKKINGVRDLTKKGISVIVVNGAGQVGMWEDVVGGMKSAEALNQFRKNIVFAAKNTGEAEKKWNDNPAIDAWLVFNIWGTRSPTKTEIVPTEKELTIYRSMGTAISKTTINKKLSADFIEFLKSESCRAVFEKEGWF